MNSQKEKQSEFKNNSSFDNFYFSLNKIALSIFKQGMILAGKDHSDPTKDSQYLILQNQLLNRLRQYHEQGRGASNSFIKYLENLKTRFDQGLISEDEYNRMSKNAVASLEKFSDEFVKQVSQINEKFNKQSNSIEKDVKEIVELRDAMLKKRILFVILLTSPFLSIPAFDAIANAMSGVFVPGESIGTTLSEKIVGLRRFGIFGEIMDIIEIDKALKYIFDDAPLISNLFGFIDTFAETQIGQASGFYVHQMLKTPLPYFVASAFGGGKLVVTESELRDKVLAKNKSQKEARELLFKQGHEDIDQLLKTQAESNAKQEFKALKDSYLLNKIDNFIKQNHELDSLLKTIFKDVQDSDKVNFKDNEQVNNFLLKLESPQIAEITKKMIVAQEMIDKEVFEKLKEPSIQNDPSKAVSSAFGNKISVKELLTDCANHSEFREKYLNAFNQNPLNALLEVADQGEVKKLEMNLDVNFKKPFKEADHKEILDPKLKNLDKNFCLVIENYFDKQFRENGWKYPPCDTPDYQEKVEKCYVEIASKELTSNASRTEVEEGVIPQHLKKGDDPITLETKISADRSWTQRVGRLSPNLIPSSAPQGLNPQGPRPGPRSVGGPAR
jgi:hypothetical protein